MDELKDLERDGLIRLEAEGIDRDGPWARFLLQEHRHAPSTVSLAGRHSPARATYSPRGDLLGRCDLSLPRRPT